MKLNQIEIELRDQKSQSQGISNPQKSECKMNLCNPRTRICLKTFRKSQELFSPKRVRSTKSRKIYKTLNLKIKIKLTKDIRKKNKSLKQINHTLLTDLVTAKNKIVSLESQQTRSNTTKGNILIYQEINQKRPKKKKPKSDTSNDASDEEDTPEIYQPKEKNDYLKQTIRFQKNKIEDLNYQINHLQEKEDEHQECIKAYNKLDRFVKKMTIKNIQVKIFW